MNICMLVYSFPPLPTGGAERQCKLQAEELVRKGHACMVVTARSRFDLSRREVAGGVRIYRVAVAQLIFDMLLRLKSAAPRRSARSDVRVADPEVNALTGKQHAPVTVLEQWVCKWNAFSFMWNASWVIWRRRNELDVIHTHVASWNAGFAAWLGKRLGIPVICKASNLPAFDKLEGLVPWVPFWEKQRLQCSFLALTPEMKEDLVGRGVDARRIHLLPNGVVLAESCAKPGEARQVLFVGNFTQGSAHKATDIVLRVWAEVAPEFPGWSLCIAGGGNVTPWKSLASLLNCEDSVYFPGRVEDLSANYVQSGVFLLLSRIEGISNALLEAQSFGLPAVVSGIPGNRAVVQNGVNGLLAPPGEVDQIAAALKKLMHDPGLRISMGHAARERIEKSFTLSKVVDRLLEVYRELTKENAAA